MVPLSRLAARSMLYQRLEGPAQVVEPLPSTSLKRLTSSLAVVSFGSVRSRGTDTVSPSPAVSSTVWAWAVSKSTPVTEGTISRVSLSK